MQNCTVHLLVSVFVILKTNDTLGQKLKYNIIQNCGSLHFYWYYVSTVSTKYVVIISYQWIDWFIISLSMVMFGICQTHNWTFVRYLLGIEMIKISMHICVFLKLKINKLMTKFL